jgi:putative transposase
MRSNFPLRLLREALGVARSGYHAWASGQRDRRGARDQALRQKIIQAFARSRQTYGYPRMTVELREQGERVSKGRVARLMRSEGLQGRQRRAYRPQTTQGNHTNPIAPNRLAQVEAITA